MNYYLYCVCYFVIPKSPFLHLPARGSLILYSNREELYIQKNKIYLTPTLKCNLSLIYYFLNLENVIFMTKTYLNVLLTLKYCMIKYLWKDTKFKLFVPGIKNMLFHIWWLNNKVSRQVWQPYQALTTAMQISK